MDREKCKDIKMRILYPLVLLVPIFCVAEPPSPSRFMDQMNGWACMMLASPGDIQLNNAYDIGDPNKVSGKVLYHTIDPYGVAGAVVDALNARNPIQDYSHSGMVTDIRDNDWKITSWFGTASGTYDSKEPRYNQNFTIVRAKGGVAVNERALEMAKNLSAWRALNYCSNVIDEIFEGRFSDQAPSFEKNLSGLEAMLWKIHKKVRDPISRWFESRTTPSSIDRSGEVEKICEVRDGLMVYPSSVQTADLAKWALQSSNSVNPNIRGHGEEVLAALKQQGFINDSNEVQIATLKLRSTVTFVDGKSE